MHIKKALHEGKAFKILLEVHFYITRISFLYDINIFVLEVIRFLITFLQIDWLVVEAAEHFLVWIIDVLVEVHTISTQLFHKVPGQLKSFKRHI